MPYVVAYVVPDLGVDVRFETMGNRCNLSESNHWYEGGTREGWQNLQGQSGGPAVHM